MALAWLPNFLTVSRIILLVPIMLMLASAQQPMDYQLAFCLFLLASLTDLIDGWAARKLDCVTTIGAFLDPLADKIMTNVLLVFLACRFPDWISLWLVLLLLAREFAVQGFRSMAPCVGVVIRTELLSKLKTLFQLLAAGSVLIGLAWEGVQQFFHFTALTSLILALLSAYVSMILIFIRNVDLWTRQPLQMESR